MLFGGVESIKEKNSVFKKRPFLGFFRGTFLQGMVFCVRFSKKTNFWSFLGVRFFAMRLLRLLGGQKPQPYNPYPQKLYLYKLLIDSLDPIIHRTLLFCSYCKAYSSAHFSTFSVQITFFNTCTKQKLGFLKLSFKNAFLKINTEDI